MKTTLDLVDKLAEKLEALKPLNPQFQKALDNKFRLEFNYNSNHLEGNTLTYGETSLLLFLDDAKGNHKFREYDEMKAHDVAFKMIIDWANDTERPLTEQSIKDLNEVILVKPFWKEAQTLDGQTTRRLIDIGDYKKYPNSVRLANGEIFEYASVTDTPIQMRELIEWYRQAEKEWHPVTLAAMLHYKFVRIHPFDDGNGRISRLLMNYVLLKSGLPPVIIKSADKNNYLNALHLADIGDYEPFIDYIAQQLVWSLELSVKAAEGENIEEKNDISKEIELFKKSLDHTNDEAVQKNHELVLNLLYTSIIPLRNKIRGDIQTFDELFNRIQIQEFIDDMGGIYLDNQAILLKNKIEFKGGLNAISPQPAVKDWRKIVFIFHLHGFKKEGTNTFHTAAIVDIELSEFKYILIMSNEQKIEKLYNQQLTEEEIEEISTATVKFLFENIKSNMNKT